MILPLFTLPEIDYAGEYALRDAFWFGRSSCKDPEGFFCKNQQEWITRDGWHEILRGITRTAQERVMKNGKLTAINKKDLLWLYLPDFEKDGAMDEIKVIKSKDPNDPPFWTQSEHCGGFRVKSECVYRADEMELIAFTPVECTKEKSLHCDKLVAYARFSKKSQR